VSQILPTNFCLEPVAHWLKHIQASRWFKLELIWVVIFTLSFSIQEAGAARGRPVLNAAKTTFVSDTGTLLRGMICGSNPSTIPQTTNWGCNAVHLYAESAGGAAAGYNSNLVDAAVAMTRTNGMYLIITIGSGGVAYTNFIYDFWNFYSKRYANETHVLFEIQNEISSGGPSSAAVISVETNAYFIIRSNAPATPVLFFSYVAFNSGPSIVQDAQALGSGINWTNAAIGFHGYGSSGPLGMQTVLKYVLNAGYPCFQTEFYRWPWGTGNFALGADASMYQDVGETGVFERLGVSWLTFMTIANFTNNARYKIPLNNGGVTWTPDYGSWPTNNRSTYGNSGNPWWTTNLTSTLRIQAENYDTGGQGVAYNDTTSTNSGATYRSDDVDIQSTGDTGGGYNIGWIVAGEWLEYTVYINDPGYYYLKLRVASPQPTNQISVSFYGVNATNNTGTIGFAGTGANQTWTTITNTIFLPPGQQRMRVNMLSSSFNLNWIELTAINNGWLANGAYKLINRNSGLALEVAGAATTNFANIDQSNYLAGANQRWNFTHKGGGQYLITCAQTGKAIDEASYSALSGDYLQAYTSADTPNQHYIVIPTDSGYFKILNANSGLVFDVNKAATTNNAIIIQYEYSGANNQQWSIQSTQAVALAWLDTAHGGANSKWDTLSPNWVNVTSSGVTAFSQNSSIVFDDRGAAATAVNLIQPLAPSNILVNATADYLWTSTTIGALAGSGTLTKSNSGTLVIDVTNTMSGAVTIYGGTLQVGNGDTFGSLGSGPVTNNALLSFNRSDTLLKITNGIHGSGAVSVDGSGSVTFSGNNNYSGNTYINSGTLVLSAGTTLDNTPVIDVAGGAALNVATSGLSLNSAQMLTGDGVIIGNVNGGGVSPGDAIGVLIVSGNLTLNGTTAIEINKLTGTNDLLAVSGTLTYGGTLYVTNLAGTLNVGDHFTVATAASSLGNFSSLQGSPGANKAWTFTNGVLSVVSTVNLTPTNLLATVSGNNLILSWPADHIGWHLQTQTNSVITGLRTNWVDVPGTYDINIFSNQIDPANGGVFYRMTYP
jgi:autotransporter-associated beta strand protein